MKKVSSQVFAPYAFLQDGIKRIEQMVGSDEFTFIVNGSCFSSTIFESVFLSPAVHDLLSHDFGTRSFSIADDHIDSNDFSIILDFIRCVTGSSSSSSRSSSGSKEKPSSPQLADEKPNTFSSRQSLLSICRHLGNTKLELMALTSSDSICNIWEHYDDLY
jgi:hypothetical protein